MIEFNVDTKNQPFYWPLSSVLELIELPGLLRASCHGSDSAGKLLCVLLELVWVILAKNWINHFKHKQKTLLKNITNDSLKLKNIPSSVLFICFKQGTFFSGQNNTGKIVFSVFCFTHYLQHNIFRSKLICCISF